MYDRKSFFLALCIGAGVAVLFLDSGAPHFFGDSIAVLWGRPHSFQSLLRDFVRLDEGKWFRPLSNSLPPFLMWPWFGANFQPYHLVALALHIGFSASLFALFIRVFKDRAAAFIAAAFFAFHPVQFYATYDIAFYQEPMTAALEIGSLVLFCKYVDQGSRRVLAGALGCLLLSFSSKETAAMLPGALAIVLGGRLWRERRARIALAAAGAFSAAFVVVYARVLGVVFRYQDTYRPRWGGAEALSNLWRSACWAFGLPAGWQTDGWQAPLHVEIVLGGLALSLAVLALTRVGNGLWRGLAWFAVASLPAVLTPHLLPHHIYFPLVGIAYSLGLGYVHLRSRVRVLAPAAAAAVLTSIFIAAFIGARNDAVTSWVGVSAWQVNSAAQFLRTSGLRLRAARGLVIRTGSVPHLVFDWMGGDVFNLLGAEHLEVRMAQDWPSLTPEGFYRLEYRDRWLWNRTPNKSASAAPAARPAVFSSKAEAKLYPPRITAGEDSYCLEIPTFAGELIDLRYRYNERSPRVAYSFTRLNRDGKTCISPPATVAWGTIDLVGARRSGTLDWAPLEAQLQVLPF